MTDPIEKYPPGNSASVGPDSPPPAVLWLDQVLPQVFRRLVDSEHLDLPYFQLPLAQMRLAQALYREPAQPSSVLVETETMGQLSERLGVRQNALTQAADRLVNRGLAERSSDPNDRRVVRLSLTELGHSWVAERHARRRTHLSQLWNCLSAEEREEFLSAVQTIEAACEKLRSDCVAVAPDIEGEIPC